MADMTVSVYEDRLWELVGTRTPKQIADELGLPPAEVVRRTREMLESVDVLTVEQQRQKLMIDVGRMARKAEEAFDNSLDERNKSGLLNSAVNAQKEVLRQLEKMETRNAGAVDALNRMRVAELVRLVETAVVDTLSEIDPANYDENMKIFYGYLETAASRA